MVQVTLLSVAVSGVTVAVSCRRLPASTVAVDALREMPVGTSGFSTGVEVLSIREK